MALGMALKNYTSMANESKLKVRESWGLIPTFVEITGEETGRWGLFRVNKIGLIKCVYLNFFKKVSVCMSKDDYYWIQYF